MLDTPDWGGVTEIATGEKSAGYTDKNKNLRQKMQKHSRHIQTLILLLLIPNILTSLLTIMNNRPFGGRFRLWIEVSKISTGSRCDAQTAKCLTVYKSLSRLLCNKCVYAYSLQTFGLYGLVLLNSANQVIRSQQDPKDVKLPRMLHDILFMAEVKMDIGVWS